MLLKDLIQILKSTTFSYSVDSANNEKIYTFGKSNTYINLQIIDDKLDIKEIEFKYSELSEAHLNLQVVKLISTKINYYSSIVMTIMVKE